MKALAPDMAVFFVKCNRNPPAELTDSMTESGRNEVLDNLSEKDDGLAPGLVNVEKTVTGEEKSKTSKTRLFEQLCELKYLSLEENNDKLLDRGSQSTNSSILAATRKPGSTETSSRYPCGNKIQDGVLCYHCFEKFSALRS